jgi:tRNA (guanosine-2'-O-)-methyltransferase
VVLDRLLDPHNVAAILRTSEGLGLCAAHVVPNADGDTGAHRRVTQDADKWIDVVAHPSGAEAARSLAAQGFAVWAGHLGVEAQPYHAIPADGPVALLFGHEHEGPSAATLACCAGTFRIPMAGFTQSFNVSVAAGIALAQICAARRALLRSAGDLSAPAKALLRARYTKLAARLSNRIVR